MFGGKGVVSVIVPDDKMLRTEDGTPVDIVMSPLAVISRINISQLYVSNLGLISKELYNRLDKFFSEKQDLTNPKVQKEEELLRSCIRDLLYETPDKSLKEVYEESKPYGFVRIRAGALDRHFTSELITDLEKRLGVKDHQVLYDPNSQKYVRTPIRVGYQDFFRLHFISENKMKVTGAMRKGGIKFGYGDTKDEGQKIGEQESWALLSYGDQDLLQKFSYEKDDKGPKFFQEMLSIGLLLNDNSDNG